MTIRSACALSASLDDILNGMSRPYNGFRPDTFFIAHLLYLLSVLYGGLAQIIFDSFRHVYRCILSGNYLGCKWATVDNGQNNNRSV